MMGILLVTAYTEIAKKGRRQDNSNGYSKYFRQARVRTVHACVPDGLPRHALLVARHLAAARSTRRRK